MKAHHQQIPHTGTYFYFFRPWRMLICQCANCFLRLLAVFELRIRFNCAIVAPLRMPARLLSPLRPGPLPSAKFSETELARCSFFKFLWVSPGFTSCVVFCLVIVPTPAASSLCIISRIFICSWPWSSSSLHLYIACTPPLPRPCLLLWHAAPWPLLPVSCVRGTCRCS